MILRKSAAELALMERAGAIVARANTAVREALRPGMTTADLDRIAEDVIVGEGAVPSFKGYHGFPATLCTSRNEQIVHGIPSRDVVLDEGDIISVDCGAIWEGFHGDSAMSLVVGGDDAASDEVRDLLEVTRDALWSGIAAATVGNRLGDIGAAVQAHADARGYGLVREYVGHGVGRALHEAPSVPNYGRAGKGLKLAEGLVIAIEPMFNLGTAETIALDDGWTVVTADGSLSAHWEHTVAVTPEGPKVLTARDDDDAYLTRLAA